LKAESGKWKAEFLAKVRPNSDPAGVNQLQFFLLCLAGWINQL